MGSPVVHFEILGKDAERLRTFYRDAFDWQIDAPMSGANVPDYTMVHPDESRGIPGGLGTPPQGYDGHLTFYIEVPDVAASLCKIKAIGGKAMMEPQQVPDGPLIGMFEDPDGHVVGLVQAAS